MTMERSTLSTSKKTKTRPRKRPRDDSFEAVAKRLECDPDMDKFLKKMGKIARAKPPKRSGK
jgi:hypothetical protein